jgi:hypothetical protein
LARTSEKFIDILDEVEDAEADLYFAGCEPCSEAEVGYFRRVRVSPLVAPAPWPPVRRWPPREAPAIAAATTPSPGVVTRRWRSPDGDTQARSYADRLESNVTVLFSPADGVRGRTVDLYGVTAVIDDDGVARLPLAELRAAEARNVPPTLRLDDDPRPWQEVTDGPND